MIPRVPTHGVSNYKMKNISIIIYIIYIVSAWSSCYGDVRGSSKSWNSSMCFENSKKCFSHFPFTLTMWPFFRFFISIVTCEQTVLIINGLFQREWISKAISKFVNHIITLHWMNKIYNARYADRVINCLNFLIHHISTLSIH